MIFPYLLYAVILLLGIPVGYLLAYLTRDELVSGRKWFKMISVISFILAIILLIFYRNLAVILTLAYICITSLISLYKSYDKRFVK
ncbi:MAG TPA: hypothetical protein VMZ91_12175 [Candidatus Paceibacterota bacterium]|nr:hypothetical protein [Candidatus Paceibacterota bacterium]